VRAQLDGITPGEGLAFEIDFLAPVFEAMGAWDYTRPDILELHFEDLVADDTGGLTRALEFVGLGPSAGPGLDGPSAGHEIAQKIRRRLGRRASTRRLSRARLETIIRAHGFDAKAGGRQPGEVDVTSHYRSGTPGDWRTHFTAEHCARFETAYPTLLAKLGYD
jgi:hypothetical protein